MWKLFGKKREQKIISRDKKIIDDVTLLKRSIKRLERREVESVDTSLFSNKYRLDYNSLLNEEQKKALLSLKGQYLVVAGAGSGKTRTIVYRTAWLIENGVDEEKILMITFTRKASEEMKERLKKILEVENLKVHINTFHSFCAKIIYKNRELFGIKELKIMEESEKKKVISHLLKKQGVLEKYRRGFYDIEEISDGFSKVQNKKLQLEEVFKKKEWVEELKTLKSEYYRYKKYKNIYEFDDLVEMVVKKFKENRDFLENIRKRIEYLIVDEYQDSNLEQRELLKLLVGESGNLMVVGDDYQSIYGFRGADFTNILKFGKDFPNAKFIRLEKNYRSSDEIIDYTNRIAKEFKLKYDKRISGIGRSGEKIHKNFFKDEETQGRYICEKILSHKEKYFLEEMAILFRNRYTVKVLEQLLQEYGIPYHKKDDEIKKGVAFYTLHAAKGLEWEIVFLPTLLDGVFPSNLEEENLEEEKRLYYVGCSRAKNFLYLTYPKYHYEKLGYYDRRSRFLDY